MGSDMTHISQRRHFFSASSGQNSTLNDVEMSLLYSAHIELTIRYDYRCNTAPTVTIMI